MVSFAITDGEDANGHTSRPVKEADVRVCILLM